MDIDHTGPLSLAALLFPPVSLLLIGVGLGIVRRIERYSGRNESMPEIIIYLVMGQGGSYEDASQWPVCYYLDHAQAQEHARLATQEIDRIREGYSAVLAMDREDGLEWERSRERTYWNTIKMEYDPAREVNLRDSENSSYYVERVMPAVGQAIAFAVGEDRTE